MVVLPRSSASADPGSEAGQITSPKVASRTVVGMVLGILCFFTIVLSYQLLSCPCRRKGAAATARGPRGATPSPSNIHAPSKPTLSFKSLCRRFLGIFRATQPPALDEKGTPSASNGLPRRRTLRSLYLSASKPVRSGLRSMREDPFIDPIDPSRPPNLRERRALRSLHVNIRTPRTPPKRYPGSPSMSPASPMRKRMAGLLHLDTNPSPRSPMSPSSPLLSKGGRSHRLYQKLDDGPYTDWSNEETYHTGKPASALISPWSPSEYEFPYPTLHSPGSDSVFASDPRTPCTPCTPPPLYPPPPAYIREVPMRSPLSAPNTPTRAVGPYVAGGLPESPPPPISPVVTTLTREIAHDIDAWSVVRTLREGIGGAPDECAFVITNDSEDEDLGSSIAHGSFESV